MRAGGRWPGGGIGGTALPPRKDGKGATGLCWALKFGFTEEVLPRCGLQGRQAGPPERHRPGDWVGAPKAQARPALAGPQGLRLPRGGPWVMESHAMLVSAGRVLLGKGPGVLSVT